MQLSKQTEKEVLQVYDTWLHSYLHGDVATYDSYFDDDYHFIGSTDNEEFLSRKDTTKFFENTAEQLAGKCDLRKETRILEQFGGLVFITHVFDAWFLNGTDYSYYGRFRFTNVLHENKDGWRFIYQHFSTPDSKTEDGETIGFDKVNAENQELREAIKRRTIELEQKNRELVIEAALERVRARTMAMHRSDELGTTSLLLFDELKALGEISEQISIGIFDEENQVLNLYATLHGEQWKEASKVDLDEPHAMQKIHSGWREKKKSIRIDLSGEELKAYNRFRSQYSNLKFPDERWVIHCAFFSKGVFTFSTTTPHDEQTMQLLERFAQVFDGTYTRFLDLQKAEAQAREARIEAALEKVRSRTMAMHKADELSEVVTVVVEKLVDLGVVLDANGVILCTYFPNSRDVLHWIASPDFSFTGSYLLPYFDHPIFSAAWESKLSGADYFSKSFTVEEKNSFFEYAFEHSDYKHFPDDFKEWVFQNDKHSLSFAWSKNSAILIPSHTGVIPTAEEAEILKRFAKVFEQAYVRFMDLQTKEEQAAKIAQEKQRLEKTLHDLQVTQKQLIQSEKMASLGELTAGIAHEIQNPLNFVNNFSEVSSELIDEMKEEMEGGDMEEVKAIANDIQQNLERILHHGKRADAIVKGMLQHSRQSSSEKAPTDINKLADEYLRLAYHGLRAKDKSFNAILETDFDPTLEKILVAPQDIGRVILNIVTNAFYAVHQKKKDHANGYQPVVAIQTQMENDQVKIAVKDNGDGIPQQIIDKIFQPFFTTKPTGEGTGLGLSLCYDIVKAHDGTLEVETKEGYHAIFIITLPK